ncbi:MAG: hypothetical protein AVDCRST_MAG73-2270 [uncultured Thermomicrobiales bacterium]|uniref:Uncharacterized protein n=1 Tax=uncultured Thermomicrobiales bacterium TaxID=1645740 RepID=A0A6J4UB04_9BACT|nr:MAG: hypothetical protein AVDCRST_MAG73-2270 [uncultured Thermomicrobiales bacterium]
MVPSMIERDFRAAEMKRQDTLAHAARMREAAGSSPGPEQPARFGVGSWSRARAANVLDRSAALLWQAARRLDRQPAFAGRRG